MSVPPKNSSPLSVKEQLINDLDDARQAMYDILNELDVKKEIYPEWTIQHILAHLAGWDDAALDSLRAYAQGSESKLPIFRGIDDYNAHSVATRQDLNYRQVYAEWELVRQQLKDILHAMPDEKYTGKMLFPWGERGPIADFVEIWVHHERGHAREIRGLITAKPPETPPIQPEQETPDSEQKSP